MKSSTEKSSSCRAWALWGVASLFFGYEFLLRVSPTAMQPELRQAFLVGSGGLGFLSSLYYWAYTVLQLPVGVLMDRYGPRLLLTFAAGICGTGTFIFATTDSLLIAGIGRLLVGAGSAFALIGALKLVGEWFPESRYGFLTGLTIALGTIWATTGEALLSYQMEYLYWRTLLYILALIGGGIALLLWIVVRDAPEGRRHSSPHSSREKGEILSGIKAVVSNRQSWLIGAYGGLAYLPLACFAELWGVPYLMKSCACLRPQAVTMASMIFVGIALGAPFFGWVSDKIRRRKPVLYIGVGVPLLILLYLLMAPYKPLWIVWFLIFSVGFFSGGHITEFAIVREANPTKAAAVSAGFGNTIFMLIPTVSQWLMGCVLDYLNFGIDTTDESAFTFTSFKLSLLLIPALLFVAGFLLLFVKETYALRKEDRSDG